MIKCPYCNFEGEFREIRAPWKFRFYTVKLLQCPKCQRIFNYYYGVSPKTGKISKFTIRLSRAKRVPNELERPR